MKIMRSFWKSLVLTSCLNFLKHDCRLLIHFQKYPNPLNFLEPSPRSTKRWFIKLTWMLKLIRNPPLTTQQKEWLYIYFRCKKVSKVSHIISRFKNDTVSTKNDLANYVLAIKRRARFVACVCVHSFFY